MAEMHPLFKSLLSPRNLKLLALAFGAGLLLFLFMWLDQRNDTDFFKASGPGKTSTSGDDEGLPAPLPADVASDQNASGLTLPPPGQRPSTPASQLPRIIEPPAPAAPSMPAAAPSSTAPAMAANSNTPVPISQPSPNYPREALRRGVGGTVRVQATVSPDGSVERMQLAESSGDRNLDRAAMEAVRRWRFQPAIRNGQPVSATVVIPLNFNPRG